MKQIHVMLDRKARTQIEDLIRQTGLPITMIIRWALNELHGAGPYDPINLGIRAQVQRKCREDGRNIAIWADLNGFTMSSVELVLNRIQSGAGRLGFSPGTIQESILNRLCESFPDIASHWDIADSGI